MERQTLEERLPPSATKMFEIAFEFHGCVPLPEAELDRRRAELEANGGYKPKTRVREVSDALRAYAAFAQSADKGAVRIVP